LNSRSAQFHSGAWPTCTARARPMATRGAARVHGAGVAHVRGPRLREARPSSASAGVARGASTRDGAGRRSARRWRDTLSYSGDLTGAWETAGKAWRGIPARGRRRDMTRRRRRRRVTRRAWTSAARRRPVVTYGNEGED
jgi:hypothetical protein